MWATWLSQVESRPLTFNFPHVHPCKCFGVESKLLLYLFENKKNSNALNDLQVLK
jgi:hypothetical protein